MDPFVGPVPLLSCPSTPQGWEVCEGQLLPIGESTALFHLIGNPYGGEGTPNFALPNLQGKEPAPGLRYFLAVQGVWPPRPPGPFAVEMPVVD